MKNIWSYRRGPLDDVHLLPVYLALFNIINIRSIISKNYFSMGIKITPLIVRPLTIDAIN